MRYSVVPLLSTSLSLPPPSLPFLQTAFAYSLPSTSHRVFPSNTSSALYSPINAPPNPPPPSPPTPTWLLRATPAHTPNRSPTGSAPHSICVRGVVLLPLTHSLILFTPFQSRQEFIEWRRSPRAWLSHPALRHPGPLGPLRAPAITERAAGGLYLYPSPGEGRPRRPLLQQGG